MAIENPKVLNVRIRNKYDSYEKWASSNLVLEAGEIAVAYTTVNVTVDNGTAQHPAILMKVGDGNSTFANLPWLSAKAADVNTYAKYADANFKSTIESWVSAKVQDTNTQYTLVKNGDYQYKLQSKEIGGDFTDTGIVIDLPNDTDAISALEELVGTEKVADQIADAIAVLDLENTYAAKEHTHTKSEITDFAHTHAKSEITDFAHTHATSEITDFDATVKAYDYATKTEAKGYADAKDEAIVAAKKAGDDAQDAVDALSETHATDKAALEASIGENAEAIAANTALINTILGNEDTNATDMNSIKDLVTWINEHGTEADAMVESIESNEQAIATLNGTGAGSVSKTVADAIAAENLSQYATDTELSALDTRVEAAESAIAALNATNGKVAAAEKADSATTAEKVGDIAAADVATKDEVATAKSEAIAAAKSETQTQVAELANEVSDNYDALLTLQSTVDELGSAANKNVDYFATAAQGAKADTAIQSVTSVAGNGIKATTTGTTVTIDWDSSVTLVFDCGTSAV